MNRFINYYKKIFSQEYMDRTISGGIKSQLTLLLVTIATVLAIFFIIVMFFSIQLYGHEEWGERLWVVYNNFVDPGNQMNETAWSSRLLLGIVSFSGSILLGGVLISTTSNIIERRVDVVNTGRMTYRNITQHYVLIGFNELSINMIRELYNECSSARILLMSGIEAATVRHRIQSALPIEIERQVLVYFGNIESIEELQRLNIASASEVYVLGDEERCGRDAKNIAIVHLVSEMCIRDRVICHLDSKSTMQIDITINKGRGYVPADENREYCTDVNVIPVSYTHLDVYKRQTVHIMETRPLSKTKRWRLVEIIERAK